MSRYQTTLPRRRVSQHAPLSSPTQLPPLVCPSLTHAGAVGLGFLQAAGFLGNANDFMHGWLNYQIEHHMFPDLSMLSYQKAAPIVRAACEKYGVPYVQEVRPFL
jgi:hypothetical protein